MRTIVVAAFYCISAAWGILAIVEIWKGQTDLDLLSNAMLFYLAAQVTALER